MSHHAKLKTLKGFSHPQRSSRGSPADTGYLESLFFFFRGPLFKAEPVIRNLGEALQAKGRVEQTQEVKKQSVGLIKNNVKQPMWLENRMDVGE